MGAVTYFVRMVAKQGQADAVKELLLTNPRRIEQGERGNLAFGVQPPPLPAHSDKTTSKPLTLQP